MKYGHGRVSFSRVMALKVMYTFMEDKKSITCDVTYDQYLNLKTLPSIKECKVIQKNQDEDYDDYMKEMQKAIELATKNETSRILQLSESI